MRYENKCECGRTKVAGAIVCSTCYAEAADRKNQNQRRTLWRTEPWNRERVLVALLDNDGAILHWQLPKDVVDSLVAEGVAYINAEDDCLVHHTAIKHPEGGYTIPRDK